MAADENVLDDALVLLIRTSVDNVVEETDELVKRDIAVDDKTYARWCGILDQVEVKLGTLQYKLAKRMEPDVERLRSAILRLNPTKA